MTKSKDISNQYERIDSDRAYTYFEVINDIEPESVLDIGMVLKRAGTVSRNIQGKEIDGRIRLDGVDFLPDVDAGVYSAIYNHIYAFYEFLTSIKTPDSFEKYDLIVAYDLADFLSTSGIGLGENIVNFFRRRSSYMLTDSDTFDLLKSLLVGCQCRIVKAGKEVSYLTLF